MNVEYLLLAAELIGTIAFAISGVLVAIEKDLDFFGALVLGLVTSFGGGVLRDVMIGQNPPVIFTNPIFATVALLTSAAVFWLVYFLGNRIDFEHGRLMHVINISDALGLGVFVTIGVDAVLTAPAPMHENALLAVFIGTITGVGGGVLRDTLVGSTPLILRKRIYAVAAIFGSIVYYALIRLGISAVITLPAAVLLVVAIRILATHFRWSLPHVPRPSAANPAPQVEACRENADDSQ